MAASRLALNAAACGLERPESRAAREAFRTQCEGAPSLGYRVAREALDALRDELAATLGGDRDGWFFTPGTTAGMEVLVRTLEPCRVLTTAHEHRGGIGAFEESGVFDVHRVAPFESGAAAAEALAAAAAVAQSIVVFSAVTFDSGLELPVQAIAERVSAAGAGLVVCDAAQAAGHVPFRVDGLDACVFSGGKWLGGPPGSGALWLSPSLRSTPLYRNGSALVPGDMHEPRGSWDFSAVPGLLASFRSWRTEGLSARRARLSAGSARFREALLSRGHRVLPGGPNGIVTIASGDADSAVRRLEELDVHAKAVSTPVGRALRFAPDPLLDLTDAVIDRIATSLGSAVERREDLVRRA